MKILISLCENANYDTTLKGKCRYMYHYYFYLYLPLFISYLTYDSQSAFFSEYIFYKWFHGSYCQAWLQGSKSESNIEYQFTFVRITWMIFVKKQPERAEPARKHHLLPVELPAGLRAAAEDARGGGPAAGRRRPPPLLPHSRAREPFRSHAVQGRADWVGFYYVYLLTWRSTYYGLPNNLCLSMSICTRDVPVNRNRKLG